MAPRLFAARRERPHRAGGARSRAAAGFTLVEVLIVLLITALVGGILMFAFERVLDIRLRLAAFLEGIDTPTLIAGWFRDSVDGLVADVKDGRTPFAGAPRRFTGLSVAPVDGPSGVPTAITWQLVYNPQTRRTYLRYQAEGEDELTVASWPGDLGNLRYCDGNLDCYPDWPPASDATGGRPAKELPALIRLEAVRGTQFWPILAAPRSARDPLPRPPNFNSGP